MHLFNDDDGGGVKMDPPCEENKVIVLEYYTSQGTSGQPVFMDAMNPDALSPPSVLRVYQVRIVEGQGTGSVFLGKGGRKQDLHTKIDSLRSSPVTRFFLSSLPLSSGADRVSFKNQTILVAPIKGERLMCLVHHNCPGSGRKKEEGRRNPEILFTEAYDRTRGAEKSRKEKDEKEAGGDTIGIISIHM